MITKPKEYYEGQRACKEGKSRNRNPYVYLGRRARGKEVWWYTGYDSLQTNNPENLDKSN